MRAQRHLRLLLEPGDDIDRVWNHIGRTSNWWMRLRAYEPGEIAKLYATARLHKWEVCFLTKRPGSAGDSVQFQTQWWLEQQGFYLPSVITVPGSRGDLANALRGILGAVALDEGHRLRGGTAGCEHRVHT